MQWLPPHPDFRGALRDARAIADLPSRLAQLATLSRHRLGYAETLQLDRALASCGPQGSGSRSGSMARLRLAILASCTVDHLLPAIRVGALRHGLLLEVHAGHYGQYRQDLLQPSSPLEAFSPEVLLFALTAADALAPVPLGATSESAEAAVRGAIEQLQALWRQARSRWPAMLIQQSFLNVAPPLFGSFEPMVPSAPCRLIERLNERLLEAVATEGAELLDVAGAARRDGLDRWFDPGQWLHGKMEVAPRSAPVFGELLGRLLAARRGLSRKCLVLDLDDTLWGGIIGDDGLAGIVLGPGSARGEAHQALQVYARQLKERGVILAVYSKNDPVIAEEAFQRLPEMRLGRSDIACFVCNWQPKPVNLQRIAAELNVGLDSLVLLDDNPAERAAVREALPMVAVPELPLDPALYVQCLSGAGYFEAVAFTAEDRSRAAQYAANVQSTAEQESAASLGDFLAGLDMSTLFGRVTDLDLSRVAQLINKTNQFNTTTRRYTQEQVARFCADRDCIALQFRLRDRLGDNGLVSAMILRPVAAAAATLEIDTWVMSCRVFGRELEFEAMNIAVETARAAGMSALTGDYVPTAKNGVIVDLYSRLGFQPLTQPAQGTGPTRWHLALHQYRSHRTHITRSPS